MSEIRAFKNQIFKYTILIAVAIQIVALVVLFALNLTGRGGVEGNFLRLSLRFGYGLAMGTCISIVNFSILAFTLDRVLTTGKKAFMGISYILRLVIYGYVFYIAMKTSYLTGMACALGFFSLKVAMYYLHGAKAKFSEDRVVSPEVKKQYEEDDLEKEKDENKRLWD